MFAVSIILLSLKQSEFYGSLGKKNKNFYVPDGLDGWSEVGFPRGAFLFFFSVTSLLHSVMP